MPLTTSNSAPLKKEIGNIFRGHKQPREHRESAGTATSSDREPSQQQNIYFGQPQQAIRQEQGQSSYLQRREQAESLKMDVPNTLQPPFMKHQNSQSTSDEGERMVLGKMPQQQLRFEDESHHQERGYAPSDGDNTSLFNFASYPKGSTDVDHGAEQTVVFAPQQSHSQNVGHNFQAEIDAARQAVGPPRYVSLYAYQKTPFALYQSEENPLDGEFDDTEEINDEYEQLQKLQNDTPSRGGAAPARDAEGKSKRKKSSQKRIAALDSNDYRSSSPLPDRQTPIADRSLSTHGRNKSVSQLETVKKRSQPSQSISTRPTRDYSSKVASYNDSSSEEDQQLEVPNPDSIPTATSNQQLSSLDYSPDTLKAKRFSDLSSLPFLSDPRAPTSGPALDPNGNPMSLPAKLINLNKMRPEDQELLFRSLTDEENTETGEWFLNKFGEELKRLMAVRLERRKISLGFEMEVHKRETMIKAKTGNVEEELRGLKKGGGELIKGRNPGVGA